MISQLPKDLSLRTSRLNRRRVKKDRRYVLCWLQQALRGCDNPIIDSAIAIGNEIGKPVVVYHGVDNRYPHASLRLHRFILEASISLEAEIAKRRLRFCRYVRRDEHMEKGLVYRLAESAACIVTDDMPTFVANRQATAVAESTDVPVYAVDAACFVPMASFPKRLEATKAFRAAHKPLREQAIKVDVDLKPAVRKFTGKLCFQHDDLADATSVQLDQLIRKCKVDLSVPVATLFPGSRSAGLAAMELAVADIIPRYKWTRNNPADPNSTSRISPYMHFGVLGPRELVRIINAADLHSAARWKFLDELLTWREYYHHLARFSDAPDSFEEVPKWAQQSLEEYDSDVRPVVYEIDDLLHARTEDEVWNAAQRQFLLDGWMHNNLRMYWVKQIIKWTPTARKAWETACYLNDRLSLDGRDPSTYGGIQWGFGRSKPAYREIPIYGRVPPKSDSALRKRTGFKSWMDIQNSRPMIELQVPAQ